jgi:uncharacterized protein
VLTAAMRPALLAAIALAAGAADFGALKPRGYVSDFAGVLSEPATRQLNEYLGRVEQSTGAQIAIVTIASLEGEPIEDVATLLFERWGIGKKGKDEGALFLLSINDRKSRLEVGYGLEPILPDGSAGALLREMRPALRAGNYPAALATATASLGERIARAKGVQIAGSPRPRQMPQRRRAEPSLGGLIAMGVVLAIMAAIGSSGGKGGGGRRRNVPGNSGRDVLKGMILGSILGQSMGHGGGGFGGYDSGGGFGGFGGGMSGGGGASMDW